MIVLSAEDISYFDERLFVSIYGSLNGAIASKDKPVLIEEGYYGRSTVICPDSSAGKITYTHHIHDIIVNNKTIVNEDPSTTSVERPYEDELLLDAPAGCFAKATYTSHVHNNSCIKHVHNADCYKQEYTGHKHTSDCYGTCGGKVYQTGDQTDGDNYWNRWICDRCHTEVGYRSVEDGKVKQSTGYQVNNGTHSGNVVKHCTKELNRNPVDKYICEFSDNGSPYVGDQLYTCGNKPLNADVKYARSCGRTVGEIVKATIEY